MSYSKCVSLRLFTVKTLLSLKLYLWIHVSPGQINVNNKLVLYVPISVTLGSLSNNDGDGYKNVTLKVNSHRFKIYRAYSISFTSSNVGKCFWSWIVWSWVVSKLRKRKESCCLLFPPSTKREFRHFHVVVGQQRQRNVQKKRDARAKLLFC